MTEIRGRTKLDGVQEQVHAETDRVIALISAARKRNDSVPAYGVFEELPNE